MNKSNKIKNDLENQVVFRSKSISALKPQENSCIRTNSTGNLNCSKPIASVSPIGKASILSTDSNLDDFKKRSALLNSKTFKSSQNLALLANDETKFDHDELFDPSIVFLVSYRCRYYDSKRRIRKGKLLLSSNELVFKCSGMPFVKAHLKYDMIEKITILERHENIDTRLLCVEYKHLNRVKLNFYFYHFLLPIKLIKFNLKYLIKKSNKYAQMITKENNFDKISLSNSMHQVKKEEMLINNEKDSKTSVDSFLKNPIEIIPIPHKRNKVKSESASTLNQITVKNEPQVILTPTNNDEIKEISKIDFESTRIKKSTRITLTIFIFMVIVVIINFLKLTDLQKEIGSW